MFQYEILGKVKKEKKERTKDIKTDEFEVNDVNARVCTLTAWPAPWLHIER